MRKQDSWTSEFRKKRFYERQYLKKQKQFSENSYMRESLWSVPKTIAVMLDLDGTTDFIDDEKAALFIRQLEIIRKKFGAELGTISISTHYRDSNKIKNVLDIFSRNLSENIEIGFSFYYGGIYNYDKDMDEPQGYDFNSSKVRTFDNYYISNFSVRNQWFAIIDDGISEDTYKKYQNSRPMLLCRPSKRDNDVAKNNFMSIATKTKGFDGVLESLDTYIDSIKHLSPEQILETQRNMMTHLSSWELSDKIRNRNYSFVERYFKEGYADEADYSDGLTWIILTHAKQIPTETELMQLRNIVGIIYEKFQADNDEQKLEKIKQLQKEFNQFQ